MKNLRTTEKLMMLSSRLENSLYARAYKKVVEVNRFMDIQHHSNHCEILNALYNVKQKKFTYLGLATLLNLSDNALRRYRTNYVNMFNFFLEIELENAA